MNWAWEQLLAPTPKLILMALADAADDDGYSWPSVAKVSKKCCVSGRTVQRVIQQFVAADLLIITNRFTATGRQTSNGYRLKMIKPGYPDKMSPSGKTSGCQGGILSGTRVTPDVGLGGDTMLSPLKPTHESSKQPPLQIPSEMAPSSLLFPPQLSVEEREAAALIVKNIDITSAQVLLDELTAAIESDSIRTSPVQWLRAITSRFHKGLFEQAGAVRIATRRARRAKSEAESAERAQQPATNKAAARAALAAAKALLVPPAEGMP